MNYIFYAFLWIIWCTLHSLLISQSVTKIMQQRLGSHYRYYRLWYNLFSMVTLFIPLGYGVMLKSAPLFILDGIFTPIRLLFLAAAFVLFIAGAKKYDMSRFTGIYQAATGKQQGSIAVDDKLDTSGVHQLTRHPWYIGGILLIWSYQAGFDLQSIISSTLLTLYFIIGAMLEERKLIAIFGDQYRCYQQQVSMLVPWRWLRNLGKR